MSEPEQPAQPTIVRVKATIWVERISEHRDTVRTSKNPDGSTKSEYGEPYWSVYLSDNISIRFHEKPPLIAGRPVDLILEQLIG